MRRYCQYNWQRSVSMQVFISWKLQLWSNQEQVFLCVLAFLCFKLDATETSKAIKGVATKKKVIEGHMYCLKLSFHIQVQTIHEIKSIMVSLPWQTIEGSAVNMLHDLAVVFDNITIPNFTISSHISGLIEKKQKSCTSFDSVIMHLAINSVSQDSHNSTYEGTLELFNVSY